MDQRIWGAADMVRARGWRTYRGSLRIARDTATQEAVQCEPGGEAGMEGQRVQWSGSGLVASERSERWAWSSESSVSARWQRNDTGKFLQL